MVGMTTKKNYRNIVQKDDGKGSTSSEDVGEESLYSEMVVQNDGDEKCS